MKFIFSALLVGAMGVMLLGAGHATPSRQQNFFADKKSWNSISSVVKVLENRSWVHESWTGSNAPYRSIAKQAKETITAANALAKVREAEKIARSRPKDAVAQFAWGYAAYTSASLGQNGGDSYRWKNYIMGVAKALAQCPSPNASEYARLRFLIEANYVHMIEIIPAGRRLMKLAPNDRAVRILLMGLLANSTSAADRDEALKYARQYMQEAPHLAGRHARLADVYFARWFKTDNVEDGYAAIREYEEFIKLTPETVSYHKVAKERVQLMKKDLAKATKAHP